MAETRGKFQPDEVLNLTDAKDELLFELEMQRTALEQELSTLRQRHEEVQASRDYYQHLYHFAPLARVMLDSKGKIQEMNLAATQIMGLPREKALDLPFTVFVAKQSVSDFIAHLRRCRDFPGDTIENELVFRRQNKEEIPVLILSSGHKRGEEMSFQSALVSIREQRKTESLLKKAKEYAENFFQMREQPSLLLDDELVVVAANPSFYRYFRMKEDIVGASFERGIGSSQQIEQLRARLLEVSELKKKFQRLRVETTEPDGSQRILLWSGQPFLSGKHEEPLVLASISDVVKAGLVEQEHEQMLKKLSEMGHQLETRVEERTNELQTANWKLQTLSARMLEAQEMERRHLARELHDEVGQQITCLQILLEKQISRAPAFLRSALQETKQASSELLETVRQLSSDLRPQLLDDFGLIAALLWHFKKFYKRTGIKVRLNRKDFHDDLLNSFLRNSIFRITQEALTNVARHADTKRINVVLATRKGFCTLKVSDKGKGFDVQATLAKGSHGLTGLQERIFLAGGTLHLDSTLGKGTIIDVELPLMTPHTEAVTND